MNNKMIGNENDNVFYEDKEGNTKVEVMLQNDNVWLNSNAISNLFTVDRTVITKHINNIYKEEELEENSTCAKIAHVQKLHIWVITINRAIIQNIII